MLLAAGRGTRLGPLGLSLPKPLVPICGYPAIRFGLAACARAGLDDVVVNLHHLGDRLRQTLGDGAADGVRIRYSVEPDLLGTGGGIAQARALLGAGRVLVINGKVVADVDLAAVLRGHVAAAGQGAIGTLVLRDDPDPRRWGAISVDATGRVVSILAARSPIPAEGPVTERMFTGIQVLEPALLDRLSPVPCDVIRDAYIPALEGGRPHRGATAGWLLRRALDPSPLPRGQPRPAGDTDAGSPRAGAPHRCRPQRRDGWGASGSPLSHRRGRDHRTRRRGRPRRCHWRRRPRSRRGPGFPGRGLARCPRRGRGRPAPWSRPRGWSRSTRILVRDPRVAAGLRAKVGPRSLLRGRARRLTSSRCGSRRR